MELSIKLELMHVPNNCSCLLISTLICRGSTVVNLVFLLVLKIGISSIKGRSNFDLRITLEKNLDLLFFLKTKSYEFRHYNSNY